MSTSKLDLRSRSWPDRKRSRCISVDPYRRPEHIWSVFTALACFYQKLLTKNCWYDLGDIRRDHMQFSYSVCQAYLYHDVWECLEWCSFNKRRIKIVSRWLIPNGVVATYASLSPPPHTLGRVTGCIAPQVPGIWHDPKWCCYTVKKVYKLPC